MVRLLKKWDVHGVLHFIGQHSKTAKIYLAPFNVDPAKSIILLTDDKVFTRGGAIKRLNRLIQFPLLLRAVLIILPMPILNGLYSLIARKRYLFSKVCACENGTKMLEESI